MWMVRLDDSRRGGGKHAEGASTAEPEYHKFGKKRKAKKEREEKDKAKREEEMSDAEEDDIPPEDEPVDADGRVEAGATVAPEDAARAVDDEMQNDNACETEARETGDGLADEVVFVQEDGMVEPAPADGTRQTEIFAIDQQDSASEKAEGDVEEPDGDDDDDKENGGDVANRLNLASGAEEQYHEGQE